MAGPTDANALLLQVSADIRQLEKQFKKAAGIVDDGSNKMKKKATELEKQFEKIGESLGRGIKKASLAASVAFGAIVGYSIKAAASAVEMRNAFEVAFSTGSKGAEAFAATLSKKVGRSQLDIMESMTRFRLLFKDQAAGVAEDLTKALQERAIDVGSLFNLKDADVVQKFFSGITGEAEPLKALGVNLNEAALKAELLRLGFKGNAQQAPETAKQIARANIILRETAIANGDAAKTIDSTANSFKKLQGEVKDSAAKFGEQFLPIANEVLKWATGALEAFNKLPQGMQLAGLGALALVAAGGPLIKLIVGFNTLYKAAVAARAAIIATTAAGGAAGAAGAAGRVAAGVGLGALGAGAGIVGVAAAGVSAIPHDAVSAFNRASKNPGQAKDADLATAIAYAAAQVDRLSRERQPAGRALLASLQSDLTRLKAEAARRPGAAPAAAAAAGNAVPQFSLSDSQKKAVGGGAGGKSPKGTKNDPVTVEVIRPETAYDPATGKQLPTFEQRQIDEFEKMLHPTPGEDLTPDIMKGIQLKPLDEDIKAWEDEMRRFAEDSERQWHDSVKDGILGGLHAAADGNFGEYLKYKLRAAIFDAAAEGLTNAFRTALNSATGSSNPILSGIGRILGFASGTSYAPGGVALVGERGPELVNLPRGSQVIPNHMLKSMGQAAPAQITVVTPVFIDAANSVGFKEYTAGINRQIAASHDIAVQRAIAIASRSLPGRAQQASRLGT